MCRACRGSGDVNSLSFQHCVRLFSVCSLPDRTSTDRFGFEGSVPDVGLLSHLISREPNGPEP